MVPIGTSSPEPVTGLTENADPLQMAAGVLLIILGRGFTAIVIVKLLPVQPGDPGEVGVTV